MIPQKFQANHMGDFRFMLEKNGLIFVLTTFPTIWGNFTAILSTIRLKQLKEKIQQLIK